MVTHYLKQVVSSFDMAENEHYTFIQQFPGSMINRMSSKTWIKDKIFIMVDSNDNKLKYVGYFNRNEIFLPYDNTNNRKKESFKQITDILL